MSVILNYQTHTCFSTSVATQCACGSESGKRVPKQMHIRFSIWPFSPLVVTLHLDYLSASRRFAATNRSYFSSAAIQPNDYCSSNIAPKAYLYIQIWQSHCSLWVENYFADANLKCGLLLVIDFFTVSIYIYVILMRTCKYALNW